MNVPFQLRVPVDLTQRLQERLADLQEQHNKEVARARRAKVPCVEEINKLLARGRRLTLNHLLRVVINTGAGMIATTTDAEILARLGEDTIVRGRPRGS